MHVCVSEGINLSEFHRENTRRQICGWINFYYFSRGIIRRNRVSCDGLWNVKIRSHPRYIWDILLTTPGIYGNYDARGSSLPLLHLSRDSGLLTSNVVLWKQILQEGIATDHATMKSLTNFPTPLFIVALCILPAGKDRVLAGSRNPETESPRRHIQELQPTTRALQINSPLKYTGSRCNVQGPTTTNGQVVMRFFAFGDTPYDATPGPPLFQGADYKCLAMTIIPGMKERANLADFVMHVGKSSFFFSNVVDKCMPAKMTVSRNSFSFMTWTS